MPKPPIEFEIIDDEDDTDEDETESIEVETSKSEEFEEIEFTMTMEEIDEWIEELTRLKEERDTSILVVDDELQLKINYVEEEEEN
jgi:hypothetical protein